MTAAGKTIFIASCRCGKTALEAAGRPIMTTKCYCKSCQRAGAIFATQSSGSNVLDDDGGTAAALWRKDRIHWLRGQEHLREYRLTKGTPTRRVVAACCGAPMFLDFTKGHWLTIYRDRLGVDAPPVERRVMTKERPAGVELADDIPNHAGQTGGFMFRLLAAWAAMGFRSPKMVEARPAGGK